MFLDLNWQHTNYQKDIWPFLQNGIVIDTSVLKIIIDGVISSRISKKESPELDNLLKFLDYIKIGNKWDKFYITPHILTETCNHLRNDYSKYITFKNIVEEILPIIKEINEKIVEKDRLMELINKDKPIVEIGDLSIFVITNDFIKKNQKVAILVKDRGITKKYENDPNVMIMEYFSIINNQF